MPGRGKVQAIEPMANFALFLRRAAALYIDGFRNMTVGRTLWAIIAVKLLIMFAVLKLFFFPDPFAGKCEEERAACVLEELTIE